MKALLLVVVSACAIDGELGESAQSLNGDTWLTVDDNAGVSSGGAFSNGVAVTNAGKVYVVGYRVEAAVYATWIVRTSPDGSAGSFSLASTYNYAAGKGASAKAVAIKSSTNKVYVTGTALDTNNATHWVTRVAATSGGAFTTIQDIAGTSVDVRGIVVWNDTIYMVANYGGASHIRYSSDGVLWHDGVLPGTNPTIYGICATSAGVYMVGALGAGWWAAATTDGTTWSTPDVVSDPTSTFTATACGEANGAVYVGGWYKMNSIRNWAIRKNLPAWSFVDVISASGSPSAIGPGPQNQVYVVGQRGTGVSGKVADWHVRRGDAAGTTWVDSDAYNYPGNSLAGPTGYAYLPATGAAYVSGNAAVHGIVRALQ